LMGCDVLNGVQRPAFLTSLEEHPNAQ
jgi:hypothetical protein